MLRRACRRGSSGPEKVLLGTAAVKVIGRSPCKVLVVPRAARITISKILVATDGSEHARTAAVEAIEITKRSGSRLIAVSVAESEIKKGNALAHVDAVMASAQKVGLSGEALTAVGKTHEIIIETAKRTAAGVIVMGAYGKTRIKRFLMGSTTETVIGLKSCAVLVAKTS